MEIGKSKATLEAVIAAAEALESAGIRASVRNVMERLGGGSPNVITAHLRAWRENKPLIEKRKAIVIDPRIADLIAEQVEKAVREATTEAIEARDSALDERDLIADTGRQLEAQVEEQTKALAAAAEREQHDAGVIEQLRADAEKTRADAAAAVAAAKAEAAELVEKARGEAQAERAKSDELAGKLGAAQTRSDSLATKVDELAKQLADALAKLDAERAGRIAAEKALAVTDATCKAAEARLADVMKDRDAATQRANKTEAELVSERGARSTAESLAAASKASSDGQSKLIANLEARIAELIAERKKAV